jgi:membrane-bound lytic murein transglycosylase F
MREEAARTIPWLRLSGWTLTLVTLMTMSTCSPRVSVIEQVQALGALRVATLNSPTTYYEGPAGPTGFEYELAQGLAEQLGVELELVLVSTPAGALQAVQSGRAHIAAAGVSITPMRSQSVQFSRPILTVVPQLIYRMGDPRPNGPGDVGDGLVVPRFSAAAEHLATLKQRVPSLKWSESEDAETEELLLKVANGEIAYTVAPSDIVAINQRYYPQLRVAFDVAEAQDVAWAFPNGADVSLFNRVQHYLSGMSEADLAQLRDRYFGHVEQVDYLGAVALADHVDSRLPKYRAMFEKAGIKFGMDWRLLAAIGYQESHWDPTAVSPTGVRGIMQLTAQTAKFLDVNNREDPAQSILGGARYVRRMIDLVPMEVQEPDRTWLALAAYNMGYGHLLDVRDLTRQRGGDPSRWVDVRAALPLLTQPRWYQKTKHGYARGHEAETYVGNVRTYYDMLVYLFGDAPQPTLPADKVPKPPDEPKDPLNIRTPVL